MSGWTNIRVGQLSVEQTSGGLMLVGQTSDNPPFHSPVISTSLIIFCTCSGGFETVCKEINFVLFVRVLNKSQVDNILKTCLPIDPPQPNSLSTLVLIELSYNTTFMLFTITSKFISARQRPNSNSNRQSISYLCTSK